MELIIHLLGWIGTFLTVWAYYLVAFKKLDSIDRKYLLLNLFGAVGLGINVLYKRAWPALGMEVIWGLITILAIIKHSKR